MAKTKIKFLSKKELTKIKSIIKKQIKKSSASEGIRVAIKCSPLILFDFLSSNSFATKLYWANRDQSFQIAGLGKVWETKKHFFLPELSSNLDTRIDLRCYGGQSFFKEKLGRTEWKSFKNFRFFIPKFELINLNSETYFVVNILANKKKKLHKLFSELEQLKKYLPFQPVKFPLNFHYSRTDLPSLKDWKKTINKILKKIQAGKLYKIVAARRVSVLLKKEIPVFSLLNELNNKNPNCYRFLFQFKHKHIFFGASPERLLRQKNLFFETEAIAATRSLHRNEKLFSQYDSLQNLPDKDLTEHNLVKLNIIARLKSSKLFSKIHTQNIQVLKLWGLEHLKTKVTATMTKQCNIFDLIKLIHPTAALSGLPTKKSKKFIQKNEKFIRGWYGAPIGWVSKDAAELSVAIRSANYHYPHKLYLYSGAGIVQGSKALKEWNEIEDKLDVVFQLIR